SLGSSYYSKTQYDEALLFYEKSLKIRLHIFGIIHADVASSYNKLGLTYNKKQLYYKAIECHQKSLEIRRELFKSANEDVRKSYQRLGDIFVIIGEKQIACKYFEEAWKINNELLGEWHAETLKQKNKVRQLMNN
ncbi:hypothetical protein RFI_40247, partial [Reticulomyxa filosa]